MKTKAFSSEFAVGVRYHSPQCKIVQMQIEGVLSVSLGGGDNIGGWESGNGDGEDLDTDW